MKTLFKQTLTVFRLILNYITGKELQIRQMSDGAFTLYLKEGKDSSVWRVKPEYLLSNIESVRKLYKVERIYFID